MQQPKTGKLYLIITPLTSCPLNQSSLVSSPCGLSAPSSPRWPPARSSPRGSGRKLCYAAKPRLKMNGERAFLWPRPCSWPGAGTGQRGLGLPSRSSPPRVMQLLKTQHCKIAFTVCCFSLLHPSCTWTVFSTILYRLF